jgi:glucan phosphoethanolaminetransferase (alkaline phosphatase superfamily)
MKLKNKKRNFIKDDEALAYIWALCVIGIFLMAVVYFPLSYVYDHLYNYITGSYTFTGDTAAGLAVMKLISSFMLTLGFLFFINWAIVNSKAQQYSGY